MGKNVFVGIIIGMLALNAFAQATYLDVVINYTPTTMDFGESNKALKDFKKGCWGLQAGASFQMGVNDYFSVVPEPYFVMKGTGWGDDNPLARAKKKDMAIWGEIDNGVSVTNID